MTHADMTQVATYLESVAVVEDTDITKDEIDWRQLWVVTVVGTLVGAAILNWLVDFLFATGADREPVSSLIMFFQ